MDERTGRALVRETGLMLLETGLVARTWGNVSCHLDDTRYLISPSGLAYTRTTEADIALCATGSDTWSGPRKPSSERGIHAASYRQFPEVGFVIHTHQTYASALGLAGSDALALTPEERAALGGVAAAAYGLPGTKKLHRAVAAALETGAHTVLMAHHGALICGTDRDDALARAQLLEQVCRRSWRGVCGAEAAPAAERDALLSAIRGTRPLARMVCTDELLELAARGRAVPAQLDDMAQMIGARLTVVPREAAAVTAALARRGAVLVPGVGAVVCGGDEDDSEALGVLAQKAAVSALHTAALGVPARLSTVDTALMRWVYTHKYARKKG